ncbi:hypothetical protein Tco_1395825 [Tanacetum coccineum]
MTYKRSKSENKGKVPTEMELVLEQTQQGSSHEVSVSAEGVEELKRIVKIKGVKKEALHTLRQKPEHPSETMVFHNEDGNPARANIKQALGYLKDGDGDGIPSLEMSSKSNPVCLSQDPYTLLLLLYTDLILVVKDFRKLCGQVFHSQLHKMAIITRLMYDESFYQAIYECIFKHKG